MSVCYISTFQGLMARHASFLGYMSANTYDWIEKCIVIVTITITLFYTIKRQQRKLLSSYKKEQLLNEELSTSIIALKKSNEESKRMSEVLDKINNLVLITNKDKAITWVNQAFLDFTGYTRDQVVGKQPMKLLSGPKTDIKTKIYIYNSTLKKEIVNAEIINYKKNGQEYWAQINLSPIFDSEGNFEFYISVETIITERKERELKIKAYNEALRKLAWTNSHAIRRPVASILSLVNLTKDMGKVEEFKEINLLIEQCSEELDEILKGIGKEINDFEEDIC